MTTVESVTCPKCKCKSHRACVNIPDGVKVQSTWLCPECKARTPKTGNLNTPVRGQSASPTCYDSDKESPMADIQSSTVDLQGLELATELRQFRTEMREARQEFKQFRQEVLEIRDLLKSYEERIDTLEAKVEALESRTANVSPQKEDTSSVQAIISGLREELNDRDQESLLTDIEVTGIPEEGEENLLHVVTACASKLSVCLEERDIVYCSRVGGVVRGEASGAARPRPVAVRLARRQVRDSLLQAARVRRSLTTEGIGLRDPVIRSFYINERLTRYNRQLFFKVRERARRLNWRYTWTKGGKIYARREHGTASFRIKTEVDLDRVFGQVNVRPNPNVE